MVSSWKRRLRKVQQRAASQPHPIRWLLAGAWARFLYSSRLCRFFTIDRGRYRVRFTRSAMAHSMWRSHDYRREEEQFFVDHVKPGDFGPLPVSA